MFMRFWAIMIGHRDDKAREVGLRVKGMAVSEGHTCSPGKAAEGTEPRFLLSGGTRKALSQGLGGVWQNLAPSLGLASVLFPVNY